MKSLALAVAIWGVTSVAGCMTSPRTPAPPPVSVPEAVTVRAGGHVVRVPMEEYVLGSILAEVSPVDSDEATVARIFDVQAVLARSYAAGHVGRHASEGFDLCDGTHCQLYQPGRVRTSRFAAAARAAVDRTSHMVLSFAARPVEALFHADCGGSTSSAGDVWGGRPVPYLLASPDNVAAASHRAWEITVPPARLRDALAKDTRSAVGRRLDDVGIATRDAGGRAMTIDVRGEFPRTVRGEDFRAILNRTLGDRALLSTRFEVSRQSDGYRFAGTGFGHGVGLCQVGAAARARRGDSLAAILGAYFPGAHLTHAS
jgi:stage II sporulation protein D